MLGDLMRDRTRLRSVDLGNPTIELDQPVEVFGEQLRRAVGVRDARIDLCDHQRRRSQRVEDAADRGAKRVLALLVGWADLDQDRIGGQRAAGLEEGRHLDVECRDMVQHTRIFGGTICSAGSDR